MNLVGKVLGNRYEILEEIGAGGMAVVYKAHCTVLNRNVAIKVLRNDLRENEEFVRRFNIEAQAAASLTHPNIVAIYDVGHDEGLQYIVMEYVEGETLKKYIDRKGKLPWREAAGYAIQICRALEVAHQHGIIHRDIKPQNIMMSRDGTLKVTDFGIAHASSQATVTIGSNAIGSVHYLSPEQARGGYTDERSDIYSLGIVLYEMLTGRVPFDNDSPVSIAIKHLQEKPVPPREYNIAIPMALEHIVMKAITKEQSLRYSSAADMLNDLEAVRKNPEQDIASPVYDDAIGETQKLPDLHAKYHEPEEQQEQPAEQIPPRGGEEMHRAAGNRKKKQQKSYDKQKERRVVIFAVIAAVIVIAVMGVAVYSLSGMGSFFSSGDEIEIPNLVGKNIDDVQEEYKDTKFNIVEADSENSTKEKGTILSQDPEGGTKIAAPKEDEETVINVTVSNGSEDIELKDYTRYTDSRDAELELEREGLRVDIVEEYSDSIPIGAVIRQSPPAGTSMEKDDTVTLYVSKGPEEDEEESPSPSPSASVSPSPSPSADSNTGSTGTGGNTGSTGNSGTTNTPSNSSPTPTPAKKSAYLTIHGPRDKESAYVIVTADGKTIFEKQMANGASELVEVRGTNSTATIEIFYDGVSAQKSTINLN